MSLFHVCSLGLLHLCIKQVMPFVPLHSCIYTCAHYNFKAGYLLTRHRGTTKSLRMLKFVYK